MHDRNFVKKIKFEGSNKYLSDDKLGRLKGNFVLFPIHTRPNKGIQT